MSFVKINPITWRVHRLKCDCGGEFEHKFSVKYQPKPFTHVCNKCSVTENHEHIYPRALWEDAESVDRIMNLPTLNQQVAEILK